MFWGRNKRKIIILAILILFNTVVISSELAAEEDSLEEVEEKLLDISEEEKEILDFLFIQAQEIQELEREKDSIYLEIEEMKEEIINLDEKIEKETFNYNEKLNILKQVLRSYQKMGPSSYIEIILDADGITNLLKRINTLRDITKNTGELLESVDELKKRLEEDKFNLDEKLILLEDKGDQLIKTIEEKEKKAEEMEEYLTSLKGDKQYYQEQLDKIMNMLEELAILVKDTSKEFTHIIKEGNLPEDKVELKLTGMGVKGIIEEEVFNEIIVENPNLPEIIVEFYPGAIKMEFPEKNLTLQGTFSILDEKTLKFQVEEGNFYGFSLNKGTVYEFFKEGDFILDIEPLIGKNTLKSIEIMEGYMELTVGIKLF
ncbi:PcsB-like coiled-coil domain-containing protein [Schnuerera sp.]|uniref:coiled-coil domain-containing protein n=1 Tax=Schnuerera sp. TaxID=2794844 RepID=UPI002B64F552|nr:hypothetical protein [Schnuerera sp.]HSH35956.1 hypothetical protein [Schnuerera sp.]